MPAADTARLVTAAVLGTAPPLAAAIDLTAVAEATANALATMTALPGAQADGTPPPHATSSGAQSDGTPPPHATTAHASSSVAVTPTSDASATPAPAPAASAATPARSHRRQRWPSSGLLCQRTRSSNRAENPLLKVLAARLLPALSKDSWALFLCKLMESPACALCRTSLPPSQPWSRPRRQRHQLQQLLRRRWCHLLSRPLPPTSSRPRQLPVHLSSVPTALLRSNLRQLPRLMRQLSPT